MGHQQRLSSTAPASPEAPASPGPRSSPAGTGIYWRLSDSLTACVATDRILFLDIKRDRYFALPDAETQDFSECLQQSAGGALPDGCRDLLVRLGIVDAGGAATLTAIPRRVTKPQPFDSEWPPQVPIRPRLLWGIGKTVIAASREIRSRPLELVLRRRLPADKVDIAAPDRANRVAQFHSIRPFIPVPRVCLHDCLALVAWLGGARGGVELVFGVSAHPFAAHCWVQAGGVVLDDHPDSPSRFQPILHFP